MIFSNNLSICYNFVSNDLRLFYEFPSFCSISRDNIILYARAIFDPWTLYLFILWVDFQVTRLHDKKNSEIVRLNIFCGYRIQFLVFVFEFLSTIYLLLGLRTKRKNSYIEKIYFKYKINLFYGKFFNIHFIWICIIHLIG
jgi:hypothetical protein